MDKKLVSWSLFSALLESVYVVLVATFMMNAEKMFGQMPGVFGMAAFLLIFVFSAAISGTLILGKPVLLYLSGKKAEAVKLFFATLGWLLIFLVILLLIIKK